MKKFTKILALVLAFAMIACFAACGGNNEENTTAAKDDVTTAAKDDADDETTAAADDVTDEADEDETAAQIDSEAEGTFKLGFVGPTTGGAAIYGTAAKNGAQIAVDEINALNGPVKFEFNAQDDTNDAETSVNAYNTLVDWGMQVLVGPVTTNPAISVAAEANNDRIFCLTPSASSTDVIDDNDNMYQVCFTDPNQGTGSADYIADKYAGAKVAVIYRNDDAYSQGIRDNFKDEADAKGIEIVYEGTFTEGTSTDFNVQLTAAKNANADLVFLPIYYQPASTILQQASTLGFAPTFFGVDGMDGILSLEGFDTSLAEGVMLLTPFSADDPNAADFVAKYKSQFNEVPNQFAADGYDAVYIIYNAILKANCKGEDDAETICDALIDVMGEISVDGLTGAGMTWDENGAVSKAPMAVVIKDGVYVTP